MRRSLSISLLSFIALTACYHATIETGLPASTTVIDKQWANSFIYGLVPPETMETLSKCPNGVAKVETQMSFLNGLVSALTGGIYTPMQLTVTCASSRTAGLPVVQDKDLAVALKRAIELANETGSPVDLQTSVR